MHFERINWVLDFLLIFPFASTFRRQIWELMWLGGRSRYKKNAQDLTYLEFILIKSLTQLACLGELGLSLAFLSSC